MSRAVVEVQMIPSHSQPPTSKRKVTDDMNPLGNASKKQKKEKSSNKRKLNGEEQPGGLVIVRAPSVPSETLQRPPSRQPSSQPLPGEPSKPPAKKFRADGTTTTARQLAKNKDRQIQSSSRADPEVDEDVRQMQSEADTLRRKSHAAEQSMGTLSIPKTPNRQQAPYSERRMRDEHQPIPEQETPQIERNRFMREGGSNHRRKSSLTRGKRISSSYEATGVISQPHTSVSDSSFYKHIDGDLPEPARARQLLIWCSHRVMNQLEQPEASSSKRREPKDSGKDPPPLSVEGAQLLKRVQESVIKMLAEKLVDTNVYGATDAADSRPKKENEQNVKNRAREIRFNAHNQRMKAEEDAWIEVTNHHHAFRMEIAAELDKAASTKAKGKQRAVPEDDWDIDSRDLPEHFRGKAGVELARRLVNGEAAQQDPLSSRLDSMEYTMDHAHVMTNSALETTRIAETDLDRRFAMLNISLASRSQPAPTSLPSTSGALSSYLPPSLSRPPPTTDPQDLLRALSRIDAERPQNQVGDAARRAVREVQRATDAPGGMTERRLTAGVAPPTPRKPPGTPRRATTPGKGR
ncbi:Mis12-Mtw1 protein family-domain-containing protein [Rhodofomes roseus]|uniref:Mis12-Mtw1 protein family-domain-containing protein n=1 Tax=Rhodofomes roseus TaxID=34475 RepID=A0ABQ8K0U4_9APHY|nr:Mis12-Mtw1 protein family-domain-containing protein [Rhodofomes roseus]KAH9830289.1 Mis12-Mtw1 protein family-domain-containing protein [Rhodofomes roseus]